MNTEALLSSLKNSPVLLRELVESIPQEVLKQHRMAGKWSIHENACHLALVEEMMLGRVRLFRKEKHPEIKPYCPGEGDADIDLLSLELEKCLKLYEELRPQLVQELSAFSPEQWRKAALHPEYIDYNPYIMARHLLMHDHFHLYRIEGLWLAKNP